MAMDILITEVVERALRRHPHPKVVRDRLRLLAENPHHPSLNAHRVHRIKERDIWECYITRAERALYEIKDGILRLWDLGSHAVVDNVHLRSFAAHTRFSRVDLAPELEAPLEVEVVEPITEPTPSRMTPPKTPVLPPHGTPNRFAFFQNAHLRILGVPANLVQSLKQAPSLELALALPGLPEQTRLWLEELSTSPELDEVMFDSSRLLFRTTLDRLEGYCEGKIKQLMLNLQPEQQQCVDMGRSPLILLKGAAGSGKTTVGIYRAIRLAEQGRRVLIVTFNRTLASVTKSLIEELIGPLPQNLRVTTLHSLMMSILGERAYKLNMDTPQKPQILQLLEDAMNEVRKRVDASVFRVCELLRRAKGSLIW